LGSNALSDNGVWLITNNGQFTSQERVRLGFSGSGSLLVDAGTFAVLNPAITSVWGQSGTASVTFQNGGVGMIAGGVALASDGVSSGTLDVLSAARLTLGALGAGNSAGGSAVVNINGGSLTLTGNFDANTGAVVNYLSGGMKIGGILGMGGTAKVLLSSGANKTLVVGGLNVNDPSKLDLSDNALIDDYTGSSPLGAISAMVSAGYNGGSWTGNRLTSSSAAAQANAPHKTALGFAEASALGLGASSAFFGQTLADSTAVLVRYTYAGDSNLNGTVDLTDFTFLAANFNGTGKTWLQGDYNYDGSVNLTDFTFLASNFNQTLPAAIPHLGATVPEPSVIALLALFPPLTRRSRRS
jgi:hypothetical protein